MGYNKIYYDDIEAVNSKTHNTCTNWTSLLNDINRVLGGLDSSYAFNGKAAEGIIAYINEVHKNLATLLMQALQAYTSRLKMYSLNYPSLVDSGDSSKHGARYTTIHNSEVKTKGIVYNNLHRVKDEVQKAQQDALDIKKQIKDLVTLSTPKGSDLLTAIDRAISQAITVDAKADSYERSRTKDLESVEVLLTEIQKIINNQLSTNRIQVASYQSGKIFSLCDIDKLVVSSKECGDIINEFYNSDAAEAAIEFAANRDARIHEEEVDGRKWAESLKIGVAVLGGAVLIAATAGGATPVVMCAVGATVGVANAAAGHLVDSYVETGSIVEGVDWSKFAFDCAIAGITGAVSGYSLGVGNAELGLIDKAINTGVNSLVKEGATGIFTTAYEITDAIRGDKSFDDILNVANENLTHTFTSMITEGVKDGVTGLVTDSLKDADKLTKNILDSAVEHAIGNFTKTSTKEVLGILSGFFEDVAAGKSSEEISMNIREKYESLLKNITVDTVSGLAEGGFSYAYKDDGETKQAIRKFFEDLAKNGGETAIKHGASLFVETMESIGECSVDSNKDFDFYTLLQEEAGEWLKDYSKEEIKSISAQITKPIDEQIKNIGDAGDKITAQTIVDTTEKTIDDIAGGIAGQVIDNIPLKPEDRKDIDFEQIWEEDLKGGDAIGEEFQKNIEKQIGKQQEKDYEDKLNKEATDDAIARFWAEVDGVSGKKTGK